MESSVSLVEVFLFVLGYTLMWLSLRWRGCGGLCCFVVGVVLALRFVLLLLF